MKSPGPWVTISSRRPDSSCWVMSTLPAKMMVRPWPTSPTLASASPAPKERTSPNRRTRSISAGSRVGNIWWRRVSMIDCVGVPRTNPGGGGSPSLILLFWFKTARSSGGKEALVEHRKGGTVFLTPSPEKHKGVGVPFSKREKKLLGPPGQVAAVFEVLLVGCSVGGWRTPLLLALRSRSMVE